MKVLDTPLCGLKIVQSLPYIDDRGAFTRFFCAEGMLPLLGSRQIVQINHSKTTQAGTLRGLHFQHPPHSEVKMIRCLRGSVYDVAVDLRADSPTFLRWHAEELSQDDAKMLVIPEGFAHGFQALDSGSELLYLHTEAYHPTAEGGVRYDDPRVGINWPLPPTDLSPRDLTHPLLGTGFTGIGT